MSYGFLKLFEDVLMFSYAFLIACDLNAFSHVLSRISLCLSLIFPWESNVMYPTSPPFVPEIASRQVRTNLNTETFEISLCT